MDYLLGFTELGAPPILIDLRERAGGRLTIRNIMSKKKLRDEEPEGLKMQNTANLIDLLNEPMNVVDITDVKHSNLPFNLDTSVTFYYLPPDRT